MKEARILIHLHPRQRMRIREQASRRAFRARVRVWAVNQSGAPFFQQVHTIDVGWLGACLGGVSHEVVAGEVLGVEYGGRRARFKVIWAGQIGTPEAGKVQLSPLEKAQDFWGLLPGAVREQRSSSERRLAPRCVCKGSSFIHQSQTRFPLGAAVTDISLSGCYAELLTTLPLGTKVELMLQVADITVKCAARVRTTHPGVGMGLEFEKMSEANRRALERAIVSGCQSRTSQVSFKSVLTTRGGGEWFRALCPAQNPDDQAH